MTASMIFFKLHQRNQAQLDAVLLRLKTTRTAHGLARGSMLPSDLQLIIKESYEARRHQEEEYERSILTTRYEALLLQILLAFKKVVFTFAEQTHSTDTHTIMHE